MAIEYNFSLNELILPIVNADIFRTNFHGAEIKVVTYNEVPPNVMEWFEVESEMFLFKDYKRGAFKELFAIQHNSGDITYAAQQIKEYPVIMATGHPEIDLVEDLVYLKDLNRYGEETGYGEIIKEAKEEIPYVGYTMTKDEYRRQGFGKRRLLMMNGLSKMLFGLPLYSGISFGHPDAKSLWEKLVAERKALKYKEDKKDRFRFI